MNKTQEALELAIKRLEKSNFELQGIGNYSCQIYNDKAIEICKQALEQQPKVTGFIRTLETVDKDGIETWKLEPFFTLQSLQEHDNEVIERCAKICDEMNNEYGWGKVAANTIRLFKWKQNES